MGPIGVGKGFREMYDFGMIDKMPAIGLVQSTGCAPMVEAFERNQRIATPIENPETIIATLATGNPGRAYELLYDYVGEYGGILPPPAMKKPSTLFAFWRATTAFRSNPRRASTFAGLFKMVREGVIKPDDVVVVNCSGHTLPVETMILGEHWQRSVDLSHRTHMPVLPQEGLVAALEQMEAQIRRIVVIEDNIDAARLIKRVLQARGAYRSPSCARRREGLETVRQVRPDLVITDLMMPDVDGFEVIDTMKADPELQHIPIVVITAKELTAKERARLNNQVDLLLKKGSSIDDEIIESLVHKLD